MEMPRKQAVDRAASRVVALSVVGVLQELHAEAAWNELPHPQRDLFIARLRVETAAVLAELLGPD